MNADNFLKYIIRPVLEYLDLWSNQAGQLLLGTSIAEMNLEYLHQIGGPGMGLYSCEPATHLDIWKNYLSHRKGLADKVIMLQPSYPVGDNRLYCPHYATAICRIHYLRVPTALPDTVDGASRYWWEFYQTPGGANSPQHYIDAWNAAH